MSVQPLAQAELRRSRAEIIPVAWRPAALLPLAAILAVCGGVIYQRTVGAPTALAWNAWGYSEWLIDYAGGFTRRGLAGELIHHWAGSASALPVVNGIVFSIFSALALALIVLVGLSDQRGVGLGLALPLLPGGPVSMAINGEFFFRKELVFIVILAVLGILYKLASRVPAIHLRRCSLGLVILLAWLALPLSVLVHESFIFLDGLAISVIVFAAAADLGIKQPRRWAASYLFVGILGVALMGYLHGSPRTAQAIWDSLSAFDREQIAPAGAVNGVIAIGWPFSQSLKMLGGILSSGLAWYWLFAMAVTAIFGVAMFYVDPAHEPPAERLRPSERAGVYAMMAAWSSPLFALGWDWGRWIAALGMSAVVLTLAVPPDRLRACLPAYFVRRLRALDGVIGKPRRSMRWMLLALLLGVGLTFRVPECCLNGSGTPSGDFFKALFSTSPPKSSFLPERVDH